MSRKGEFMFRLSNGLNATGAQLKEARNYVAEGFRRSSELKLRGEWGYAPHVDEISIKGFAAEDLDRADEVELGWHDHKFWCWQQMNFFITGESVPFLPPPPK